MKLIVQIDDKNIEAEFATGAEILDALDHVTTSLRHHGPEGFVMAEKRIAALKAQIEKEANDAAEERKKRGAG